MAIAGCGRDDFENDPRPPLPAEVSIELGQKEVVVSPAEFGAGLVNFTIANLGRTEASIAINRIQDGAIVIDRAMCNGCTLCVQVCPKQAISREGELHE